MRPSFFFALFLLLLLVLDGSLYLDRVHSLQEQEAIFQRQRIAVAALGLTDLCIATEARYTRHPAVSDPMVPVMDHPGAMEHFPSGSFWAPPPSNRTPLSVSR